jgi:hypothetical protein
MPAHNILPKLADENSAAGEVTWQELIRA